MARPRRRALQPSDIEGLEYFDTLVPLLAQLKDIGTQRDRAGNRQLFYDQYVCLLLLYFFSPTITSLRLCSRLRPWRPFNDDWGFGRRRWAPLAKPRGCLTPRPCTKSSRNWRPRPRRWSMDPTRPVARSHRRRRQYLSRVSSHGMGPVERLRTSRRQAALALRRLLRNSPGCFHYPRLWLGNGSAAGHAAAGTPVRH